MDPSTALELADMSLGICVGLAKKLIKLIKNYKHALDDVELLEDSIEQASGTAEEFKRALDGLPQTAHIKVNKAFDRLNRLFGEVEGLLLVYAGKPLDRIMKIRWALFGKSDAESYKGKIDRYGQ